MVKKINSAEFKEKALKGLAVIDFNATWCGPCKMLAPVIDEVSEEIKDVNFFAVDVDEESELAEKYGITNIPAILVLKDGEKKDILVGFKPKEELMTEMKNLL